MARILEKIRYNTIRGRMAVYSGQTLGVTAVIFLVLLIFNRVSLQQYDRNMERLLCLNRYYSTLDNTYQCLKEYIKHGENENYAILIDETGDLQVTLNELTQMNISDAFYRDMLDLSGITSLYEDKIEEIRRITVSGSEEYYQAEAQRMISGLFSEADEIYRMIGSQYKDLHMTLVNNVNEMQKILSRKISLVRFLLLVLLAASFCLLISRCMELTTRISRPLRILQKTAEQVIHGDLNRFQVVEIEQPNYEEAETLVSAFNLMLSQLKDHISMMEENEKTSRALHEKEIENMRISTLLKASELKTLQLQMNPHFLFNTLTMIAQTAYLEDTELTVDLLHRTADLLRYNLDYSGKSVTLAYEIEMLGNYIYIQEQRFGERIEFDFVLDERFHRMKVPSFILQPLVENSIIHGIGSYQQNGKVVIRTAYLEDTRRGMISIWDNGLGMTKEEQAELLGKINSNEEQIGKIGVANVYKRLQYHFHDQCSINIVSGELEGTEIQLFVPVDSEILANVVN